jgi:EAL domain-containing protein (putative c-di-GMP-specific phosphodiesterase class I)
MTGAPDPKNVAVIRLDNDEAVVLFELLSRWSDAEGRATPSSECIASTAESAVLNSVLADLERQLVAPFKSSYEDDLREARTRLALRWD